MRSRNMASATSTCRRRQIESGVSLVPMRRLGADCFVVALRRGNARGAKGAGHRHLARVNRQREEPDVQWKAAAFVRWYEPDDARVSSPVPRGARGEIPRAYSARTVKLKASKCRPVCPNKQTLITLMGMSESCQQRSF